jgi:hypothetical protein
LRNRKVIDLTGQVFNRLTVIERAEDYIESNGKRRIRWLCKCSCELKSEIIVNSGSLKSGHTQSCGCLQREKASGLKKKYNTYDLTGEYGIGYTSNNEPFYFDLEDYDKIKDYCWYFASDGYVIANNIYDENSYLILIHRLVMDCAEDMEVDHKFHNRFDNRKEFLRIVTSSQNRMNVGIKNNNSSGVTGVYWHKKHEHWQASIGVNGKLIHLGIFDNFDEAVEVRKQAEIEYFGEYQYKEKVGD